MVTKLELGKKLIMDLIEQSVTAYEQREELCNKLQNLEGKSQNEQNLHLQVSNSNWSGFESAFGFAEYSFIQRIWNQHDQELSEF